MYCLAVPRPSLWTSPPPPEVSGLGMGKRLGGDQLGQQMQTDLRDVLLYHMTSLIARKTEGKQEDAGTLPLMAFVILNNPYR